MSVAGSAPVQSLYTIQSSGTEPTTSASAGADTLLQRTTVTTAPTSPGLVGPSRSDYRDWTMSLGNLDDVTLPEGLRSIYAWFRANPSAERVPSTVIPSDAPGAVRIVPARGSREMEGERSSSEYSSLVRALERQSREGPPSS